jgi:hypothetical protein
MYLIGKVAVGIILPESNGTIDPNTEDWTDEEIEKVLSKIQSALDWWASRNPNAAQALLPRQTLEFLQTMSQSNAPKGIYGSVK